MSKLTALRMARWARRSSNPPEHPNFEALIEQETQKIADGFHYARWIVPLVGAFFSLACFLPLALTVHPLFWIGVVGTSVLGGVLGGIFHLVARTISPAQLRLRKQCHLIGNRMIGLGNLTGVAPTLAPKVAEILDEAARTYLLASHRPEQSARGVWSQASGKVQDALDDAMAQMLLLAKPETPQAQEVELARGWAQPLLREMKATAQVLMESNTQGWASLAEAASPLERLADARTELERLGTAMAELDQEHQQNRL